MVGKPDKKEKKGKKEKALHSIDLYGFYVENICWWSQLDYKGHRHSIAKI